MGLFGLVTLNNQIGLGVLACEFHMNVSSKNLLKIALQCQRSAVYYSSFTEHGKPNIEEDTL